MKGKHTQGEWIAKDGQIYSLETGKTHALIPYFDKDNEEHQANQKLIENAPKMLQMLNDLLYTLEVADLQYTANYIKAKQITNEISK